VPPNVCNHQTPVTSLPTNNSKPIEEKRKVYVETATDTVRFHRRVARDIRERGETEASVAKAWVENVLPTHQVYVEPQRARADVVSEANVGVGLEWCYRVGKRELLLARRPQILC
jgi:Phosphoribulokinase / Uridine kinase family